MLRRAVRLAPIFLLCPWPTLLSAAMVPPSPQAAAKAAGRVHETYPAPTIPFDEAVAEPEPDDSLAAALADAYATNPVLNARRYDLRGIDDALGLALADTRATARVEVTTGYAFTDPGLATVARLGRAGNDRRDDLGAQIIVDQPLSTGGRATAGIAAARGDILAGREALRAGEGDLLLALITACADLQRDRRTLAIRERTEKTLAAMLDEVIARRDAGELTRTDIAQAQTQLETARTVANAARAQVEQSRASFTALVGRQPGLLATLPPMPLVPASLDEAFETAVMMNPDLAQAVETEKASRARIAAARAVGRPTVALRGTAGTTGPVSAVRAHDQDLSWSGRATLTIPLLNGGRVAAGVDQALDRNSADRFRVEAARRQMVQNIVGAWNQLVAADRNRSVQEAQIKAARIFYEGTFTEYRAGLRSTFDVLFAQNSLRDAQVALLSSEHDGYVARAGLLRHIGQLEVAKIMTGNRLHDPVRHTETAERRAQDLLDGTVRTIDRLVTPDARPQPLERPPLPATTPPLGAASVEPASRDWSGENPSMPRPDTSGAPVSDRR